MSPLLLVRCTSAPASTSASTAAVRPRAADSERTVVPSLLAPSTCAPAFTNAAIAATWPRAPARCSGVQSSVPSCTFGSAPAAICRSISATSPLSAASHSLPFALAIAPLRTRHARAGSLPLVARPHAHNGRATGGGVRDRATRGRRACRAVSRAIPPAGAAAHGRRRGYKTRPSAPGATRGGPAWAARARRRAGHTRGGCSSLARDRGSEIGPPPTSRLAIAPSHPPSRCDAHLLRADERVGAETVRWKCGRSVWPRRPPVRWG
jgi:hypothetical protein